MNGEKPEILSKLSSALFCLSRSISPEFIPGCGADIAFAKSVARDRNDIASVRGRITAPEGSLIAGEPAFGEGGYAAKVLLTALKFDPLMRSTGIIRCTPGMVRKFDELFFETCCFNPAKEPVGISTWTGVWRPAAGMAYLTLYTVPGQADMNRSHDFLGKIRVRS